MSWVKNYELVGSLEEAEALLEEPGWMLMGDWRKPSQSGQQASPHSLGPLSAP